MDIHVHIHHDGLDERIMKKLDRIERHLVTQEENLAEIQATVTRIESATTKIGEDIRRLSDQIDTGLSQAQVDSIKEQLNARADALEALDAQNPEPEVPPVEEPPTT